MTVAAEITPEALFRLDILVDNAGTATTVPAVRETPEEFRAVVDGGMAIT